MDRNPLLANMGPEQRPPIDTYNEFLVGVRGDRIGIARRHLLGYIGRDQALRLAAWLVVLADPMDEHFAAVLEAVRNT